MTRNIGKNRHEQRDYKYQDQERVPEAFEDIYDPIYDEYITSEGDFWDDWRSVDSDEAPLPKIRYKRSSDLKTECCAKDENKHSTISRVAKKKVSFINIIYEDEKSIHNTWRGG
ncbi:hypothetical protein MKX03_005222 [Papaver bracteatum]|nr:hypothetical protein MKX03_005222 [Papaver bracteatum]